MDFKKIKEAERKFDSDFMMEHLDFVEWWAKHPHNDAPENYKIPPRKAWQCKCYRDEYMEAKSIGLC